MNLLLNEKVLMMDGKEEAKILLDAEKHLKNISSKEVRHKFDLTSLSGGRKKKVGNAKSLEISTNYSLSNDKDNF